MAVYTPLSNSDAARVARAHSLGECDEIIPVAAGSVNSNFFLRFGDTKYFLRIYEEQQEDGVSYEWALLEHLSSRGVPVPRRVEGPGPGELCVAGKPTALFHVVPGSDICHRLFDVARARAVGATLGAVHRAGGDFGWRRESRFSRDTLPARLDEAAAHGRPELDEPLASLRAMLAEANAAYPVDLPTGIIHGDMFRDNVFWTDHEISAVIDWESASHGDFLFDIAVVFLAWCYGDDFCWDRARALAQGYQGERPVTDAEREGFRAVTLVAAIRFATTRILDFHLREGGVGERVMKDYRRFVARAEAIRAMSSTELAQRVFG